MTETMTGAVAAMAGKGSYNRHSGLQQANLQSALPLLADAASAVSEHSAGPVTIVDYGASQGRNSMAPMASAIDLIRHKDPARPVQVVHTDLPSNDFASLFTLLATDPTSYLGNRENVYPSAIGRSYFDSILPPGSVDLGWSSNSLHWMSRSPVDVADHGWAVYSQSAEARAAVDAVLAEDWLHFLRARATELRLGGRLICQFMGRGTDGHGFEWMAGNFWQSIVDMQRDGLFTAEETLRMTSPSAGRSLNQLSAPFEAGQVPGLVLDHLSAVPAPDPYWDALQKTGNAAEFGRQWASMMCAANGPNFLARLDAHRDRERLTDEIRQRLAERIEADPQPSQSVIVIMSISKAW
jgi:cyclopropane-fatty-acyl-phospholipid synthase